MRKTILCAFISCIFTVATFAEDVAIAPTITFGGYMKTGGSLRDNNGETNPLYSNYNLFSGDFKADYNGTGLKIGADQAGLFQGSFSLTNLERFNVYSTLWSGNLYLAAGTMEDDTFFPRLANYQTEVAGIALGKNLNQWGGPQNSLGVIARTNPTVLKALTVGVFVPMARRLSEADGNGKWFANMEGKESTDGVGLAGKYNVKGLGTVYAGYLGEAKMTYGAFQLQVPKLSKLTANVGITSSSLDLAPLSMDYEVAGSQATTTNAYGMPVSIPGTGYKVKVPLKQTAIQPYKKVAVSGGWDFAKNTSILADAIYTMREKGDTDKSNLAASNHLAVQVRGQVAVFEPLVLRIDSAMQYETGDWDRNLTAGAGWAEKKESLETLTVYPQLILVPDVPMTNTEVSIGWQYDLQRKTWNLPISLQVYF